MHKEWHAERDARKAAELCFSVERRPNPDSFVDKVESVHSVQTTLNKTNETSTHASIREMSQQILRQRYYYLYGLDTFQDGISGLHFIFHYWNVLYLENLQTRHLVNLKCSEQTSS